MNNHYIKPEQYIELYTELAEHNLSSCCTPEQYIELFVAECNAIEAILNSHGIAIDD